LKAAVYHGPRDIRVEDVAEPQVKRRKVMVKFKVGSICGTDLHFYRGEWVIRRGRIIGHDGWGTRADTGERVVMMPLAYCGHCYFCQRGLASYCERYGTFAGIDRNGFFTETIAIRPRNLIPIPDNVGNDEAAIMEPIALALHVMHLLKPNVGDWATVIGQGPIGLLMTQVAKLKGCKVIAIDVDDLRLKLAQKFGADICINANNDDVVARVKEVTKRGSDVVVEAAGSTKAVEQTPFLVRKAGKVALAGEFKGFLDLGLADGALFFTAYISPAEYPTALRLLADKKVNVKNLITHRFRLEDFEKAIQVTNNPADRAVKVLITE